MVEVTADAGGQLPGRALLFDLDGVAHRQVLLETYGGQARLVIDDPYQDFYSDLFPLAAGDTVEVVAHARPETGQVVFTAADVQLQAPLVEWDADWISRPVLLTDTVGDDKTLDDLGLTLADSEGPPLELCNRLLADSGGDSGPRASATP